MKPNPSNDRYSYIPPSIEKAMSAKLPAHLQQYVGDNRPAYVPPQIQKELNKQFQTMPTHLRQYSGAFMQQRVVQPNFSRPSPINPNRTATDLPSRPPTPDPLRLEHSMPVGEQPTVKINTVEQQATNTPPQGENFGFIMSPEATTKKSPLNLLSGGSSMIKKIAILTGGAAVLIIAIILFTSLFLGSNTNTKSLISLAQQQNELIRVATEASNDAVNQSVKNVAMDIQLSLTTDQSQITSFLSQHHTKISSKQLSLTQSSATDQQLTQAQAASNFDTVYLQITQAALKSYEQNLSQTFKSTSDSAERQILNSEFVNAQILLGEANSAAQGLSAN